MLDFAINLCDQTLLKIIKNKLKYIQPKEKKYSH